MQVRTARVNITYEGKDITRDIAPFLLLFTYTDNSGSTSDDIAFSLEDREGLWGSDWFPCKGDKVRCSIISEGQTAESLPCGEYEVDQIDYAAPPRIITIKGVSTAISHALKGELHTKAWENVTLSTIAGDIAAEGNVSLYYDAPQIQVERREQVRQSDLAFLQDLCGDYGLSVKCNDGKLIVYDEDTYDAKNSVSELHVDDDKLVSYRFTSKGAGVYQKARVKYHDARTAQTYEAEAEDGSVEGSGRVLELRGQVDNQGDAQKVAQKTLSRVNRGEVTGSITLMGDVRFRAGVNITLSGFGAFSGKYSVDKVTHSLGNGYTTTLDLKQGSEAKAAKKKGKVKVKRATQKAVAAPKKELYYEGTNYYGYKGE